MAARLGFKVFIGLLVMVPILTLLMIVGLERSYVEQLHEAHDVSLTGRSSIHKRSPLEQRQEPDGASYERVSMNANNKARSPQHRAQVFSKSSPLDRPRVANDSTNIPVDQKLYEALRKRKTYELRVEKSMRESWWYIRSQLSETKLSKVPHEQLPSYLTHTANSMKHQYDALRKWYTELNSVTSPDSLTQLNWQYWQKNVSIGLQALMEKRIHHLQNPTDCDSARKLVCQVGKTCGFGCQIHHVTYCFIMAYASERTLVLESKGWSYNTRGWDSTFLPVTPCTAEGTRRSWSLTSTENTVSLTLIDNLSPRPPQLPMAVPRDIVDRIMSFHGLPFAWFVSQFISYLMRPSPSTERYIQEKKASLGLDRVNGPIVGIHVRRTDKKIEARYHGVEEYMDHVEGWYEWYELLHGQSSVQRKVFIATDEPSVLTDANRLYPQYKIYSDAGISSLASKTSTRYSQDSLHGVIFDVTMLSRCDYIVCTFSSQVCRLAYELMQKFHTDASSMYYSLDDVYYFGGQQPHNVEAIQNHKASNNDVELSFKVGDLLGIAGNEKNGYSVGRHGSTRQRGQYPSYKVEEHVLVADFPTYNDA